MDINRKNKIIDLINELSLLTNIDSDQKKQLIEKFKDMSDKEIAKELLKHAYCFFQSDSEKYDSAIDSIRRFYPALVEDNETIKTKLKNVFENTIEGNMPIEQNHRLVKESLIKFCNLFNSFGIDYYIVGALPCFIKTGQNLFRYHDDIDIMINEKDIGKASKIMETNGYDFYDYRFPTINKFKEMQKKQPPHTVLAQNKQNEFHIGFFCFVRAQDNSIIMREYSHREENGRVVVDILERHSTIDGTKLRYDEDQTIYQGVSFKTATVESVYSLKCYTKRPKDLTDIKKLQPYVDKEKLGLLAENPNKNVMIEDVENNAKDIDNLHDRN